MDETAVSERRREVEERGREAEREQLRHELMEAERRLSEVPALQQRIRELERERDELATRLAEANRFVQFMRRSASWRVTAPLRSMNRLRKREN